MHTTCLISRHTLAHISRLSLKSQDFPPQPIWSDIIPLSVKDCSSAIFPPSSFSSASSGRSRCRSCTYSDSTPLRCFHDNSGREHYPEGFSQWWWLLFGWLYYWGQWSWQPLCACFGFMHVCGWNCRGALYACINAFTAAHIDAQICLCVRGAEFPRQSTRLWISFIFNEGKWF